MLRFAFVPLALAATVGAGLVLGGTWAVLALFFVTVFAFLADVLEALPTRDVPPDHPENSAPLLVTLACCHVILLIGGALVLAGETVAPLPDKIVLFLALALYLGQVSYPAAHEMIHHDRRGMRRMGGLILSSLMIGHHRSAHLLVHHVHAATARDPNTARLGEGFWRYAMRAVPGAFVAGLRAEAARHKGLRHPYFGYLAGALGTLALAVQMGGGMAAIWIVALSIYAQLQIYLSDYVQHYGLSRRVQANGRMEPMGPAHSWNSPHGFTSALMLNATRHSDHHVHPKRPFHDLELNRDDMPLLPYPLPAMAVIATIPPLWRRVMDPRARAWANLCRQTTPASFNGGDDLASSVP